MFMFTFFYYRIFKKFVIRSGGGRVVGYCPLLNMGEGGNICTTPSLYFTKREYEVNKKVDNLKHLQIDF